MNTLGQRIAILRKNKGLTQEDIAKKFNISIQAVSKWEKDSSSPDISIIKDLAEMLGVSTDYLLSGEETKDTVKLEKRDFNKMVLRINILSKDGEKVKINLPLPLISLILDNDMDMPKINGRDYLKNVNLKEIINLVEQGIIGELVNIESSDGDIVSIIVE
jgi:transcriptional regulator with XRE-family HTH domain